MERQEIYKWLFNNYYSRTHLKFRSLLETSSMTVYAEDMNHDFWVKLSTVKYSPLLNLKERKGAITVAVTHHFINCFRKYKKTPVELEINESVLSSIMDDKVEDCTNDIENILIYISLSKKNQWVFLMMLDYQHIKNKDISEKLEIPLGTVDNKKTKVKEWVKRYVEDKKNNAIKFKNEALQRKSARAVKSEYDAWFLDFLS